LNVRIRTALWSIAVTGIFVLPALSQSPANDPLHSLLFPPEMLLKHREQLSFTDEQVSQLREKLEQAGPKGQELQQRLNKAMGELAKILAVEQIDEQKAIEQLDEVLAAEKEFKQLHLRLSIQIRNDLTPEQRQKASAIRRTLSSPDGLQQRLQAKLAQIEQIVRSRAGAGDQPHNVLAFMQKFPELMQNGQVQEAEALLDQTLRMLGIESPQAPSEQRPTKSPPQALMDKIQRVQQRAQKAQQAGKDVSSIAGLMQRIRPLLELEKYDQAKQLIEKAWTLLEEQTPADKDPPQRKDVEPSSPIEDGEVSQLKAPKLSPAELTAQIESLQQNDVAWKKIEWKTCLLEGLATSRVQNKPLALWIFIDRPIDDERC
jgi:Spy/CpxP family protein refolding chaperone